MSSTKYLDEQKELMTRGFQRVRDEALESLGQELRRSMFTGPSETPIAYVMLGDDEYQKELKKSMLCLLPCGALSNTV